MPSVASWVDDCGVSAALEASFRDWYARAGRSEASPATAARIWESVLSSRPSDQLFGQISTPTLVLLRRDNAYGTCRGRSTNGGTDPRIDARRA